MSSECQASVLLRARSKSRSSSSSAAAFDSLRSCCCQYEPFVWRSGGEFGALPLDNPDTRGAWTPEVTRLATTLRDGAGGHLPHVAFAGSGAHANEIALRAAAEMRPGCRAIVAFEGGFHGRTLLALHTTWNPKKRERCFQFQSPFRRENANVCASIASDLLQFRSLNKFCASLRVLRLGKKNCPD